MKKLILVVLLVILLWFTFGCQNKAEKAELEDFRARAKVEEQNRAFVEVDIRRRPDLSFPSLGPRGASRADCRS